MNFAEKTLKFFESNEQEIKGAIVILKDGTKIEFKELRTETPVEGKLEE
jgi:hypothetical protein